MLIALGLEPDQMDTTVLPTPSAGGGEVDAPDPADSLVGMLAARPDLAGRWQHMVRALDALDGLDPAVVQHCRDRLATLLGGARTAGDLPPAADEALLRAAIGMAELFVIDVRAIDAECLRAVTDQVGQRGLVQLVMNLAVFDGIHRFVACAPGSPLTVPTH